MYPLPHKRMNILRIQCSISAANLKKIKNKQTADEILKTANALHCAPTESEAEEQPYPSDDINP